MSNQYEEFPDAEAVAGWALRTDGVAGGRVYSSIPASPTFPLVVVHRIGGRPAERHHLDGPRIQIDVWGGSKSDAFDIAQRARVVLHSLEGTSATVAGGAPVDLFVTGVEDDLGLFFNPDPQTGRDRYVFGVRLFVHR